MVCIMDEVSAFLSAQNQYRGGKGSDREAWLSLYDGKPARVVRVSKTLFIRGARISIFGGTQPGIWKVCFKGGEGVYLEDGTVFRFLPVYEGSAFHPLTAESWSDENKGAWEDLLKAAMAWADSMQERGEKKFLVLSQGAQEIFFDWRNELTRLGGDLPLNVRGFIPKLVGNALRFAGIFYLMDVFSKGEEPGAILNPVDIKKGISVSEFYLGHIIAAMELLTDDYASQPFEVTEQAIHLAKTLDGMRPEVDSGRLAVGYVWERFNKNCRKEQKVKSERAMGAVLRRCGLNIANGKNDANQRRRVRCLQWDQKVQDYIHVCLQSHQRLQNGENQLVIGGDIGCAMSAKSPEKKGNWGSEETWETIEAGRLRAEQSEMINNGDVGDFGDVMPAGNQNRELDWSF